MRRSRWIILLIPLAFMLWACGVDSAERNNAGNEQFDQGDYVAALDAYQAAQVADPDRSEFYFNAASAYIAMEDTEKAVAALEQAIAVGDDDMTARAYFSMGNIYFDQEDYAGAVDAYRQVLLRRPDDSDARHNLELALLHLVPPTPTAIEMQVEPEENSTDPSATPTNLPAGSGPPSATPPPMDAPPNPDIPPTQGSGELGGENTHSTPLPDIEGSLTIEEAADLLDDAEADAETLRKFLRDPATPGAPAGNDW